MPLQEFVSAERECILTVSMFNKFDLDEYSPTRVLGYGYAAGRTKMNIKVEDHTNHHLGN
jgi:hypothetical protein